MSIDFCAAPFVDRVECNRPCVDDRTAANLVSLDDGARNAGMILESFVSVPVEVSFSFLYPINVAAVRVFPRIVSHRTTSLELWIETDRGNYFCVSRSKRTQADTFHFFNLDYRPRRSVQSRYGLGPIHPKNDSAESGVSFVEDTQNFKFRFGVKRIVLRVTGCQSPRSPGIGRLEIWGQPSRESDNEAVNNIVEGIIKERREKERQSLLPSIVYSVRDGQPSTSRHQSSSSLSTSSSSAAPSLLHKIESTSDLLDAFPDFFDPITYEVMTYPLLLPSAYTVDKATLEKYCEQEMHHGRPPNDPFTRKVFEHPHSVPVPNTALKDRIDEVIRRHQACGSLTELGRCVGDGFPRSPFVVAGGSSTVIRTSNLIPSPSSSAVVVGAGGGGSGDCEPMSASDSDPRSRSLDVEEQPSNKRPRLYPSASKPPSSHAEELKRSLDDSIASILSASSISGPERPSSSGSAPQPPLHTRCSRCDSSWNLYRMPCDHLLCRHCLTCLDGEVLTCPSVSCRRPARKASVIKVHT